MAANAVNSSTGQALLPDIGTLSYNGVTFSALYKTRISGQEMQDEAGRTIKYVVFMIDVDAYVTLSAGTTSIDNQLASIQQKLSAQGGTLVYSGKGFGPMIVNAPGGGLFDVAWGPKPKVLEFQPLGGSNGALVRWTVEVALPEQAAARVLGGPKGQLLPPPLQFNYEVSIGYDEDCYSTINLHGTLEIPLTRKTQADRSVPYTVDDYRERWLGQVADSFDLTHFRVTRRNFIISRDRRTMTWEFVAEELAPMALPVGATRARGTFSLRPQSLGAGLVKWVCSLRCTYTIAKGQPRRLAWAAFVALLAFRMQQAQKGSGPAANSQQAAGVAKKVVAVGVDLIFQQQLGGITSKAISYWNDYMGRQQKEDAKPVAILPGGVGVGDGRRCLLIGFEIDEGLYDDSRQITFGATWMLYTTLQSILKATGVWFYTDDDPQTLRLAWKASMLPIMGPVSWLDNHVKASEDAIVDFGS